jgi:hypothetical protein
MFTGICRVSVSLYELAGMCQFENQTSLMPWLWEGRAVSGWRLSGRSAPHAMFQQIVTHLHVDFDWRAP